LHWLIRAACFIGLWAITYGVIWLGKFAIENKVLVGVIAGIVLLIFVTKTDDINLDRSEGI